MPIAITVNPSATDAGGNNIMWVFGTLAFSGNYTTGGDTLDFSSVAGGIPSAQAPIQVSVSSEGGGFYQYVCVRDPSPNNWKVRVANPDGTELLGGAAYPAGVTGDVVTFQAVFRKLL